MATQPVALSWRPRLAGHTLLGALATPVLQSQASFSTGFLYSSNRKQGALLLQLPPGRPCLFTLYKSRVFMQISVNITETAFLRLPPSFKLSLTCSHRPSPTQSNTPDVPLFNYLNNKPFVFILINHLIYSQGMITFGSQNSFWYNRIKRYLDNKTTHIFVKIQTTA